MRVCSVEGCGEIHQAGGFCSKHYARVRKHGDASVVGSSPRPAQQFYDDVVKTYEGDDCLVWPLHRSKTGYGVMRHHGRAVIVSRRICEETYGSPPTEKMGAAHSCGNGHLGCVNKAHVTWKTPVENAADRLVHGTAGVALNVDKVKQIKADAASMGTTALSRKYNVSLVTIKRIKSGETWGNVQP